MSPKPPPTTPTLIATWSPNASYLLANDQNLSELDLQIGGDTPVVLNPGDEVAITHVPSDWIVTPGGSNWSWTGKGLTWNGPGTFAVNPAPQSTQLIYLTVTPSAKAGNSLQVGVQLILKGVNPERSTQPLLGLSLYRSQPSLAATAKNSAVGPALVVLSNPPPGSYLNNIVCELLAVQEVSQGTQLTLSFYGWVQDQATNLSGLVEGEDLKISGDAFGDTVPFTSNGNGTWTASLPDLAPTETLDVTITGLGLSSTTLDLLEVRFETGQDTTSAWFTAFGPYTVGVDLDTALSDAGKYTLRNGDPGTFLVYFLDKEISQNGWPEVPLDWFVLAGGQKVFPPVPARFSLNGQPAIDQQSENLYKLGSNTLCLVDPSNTTIAQCDIDLVAITKDIPGPFSLRGSDLSGYDLSNWTNLAGSDFTGAKFVATKLSGAMLDKCVMDKIELNTYPNALPYGTTFTGSSFVGAQIGPAQMTQCNLTGCDFTSVTFSGTCTFPGCNFHSSKFISATLTNVQFGWSEGVTDLTSVDFSLSTITQARFYNCDVSNADFGSAKFGSIESSGLTAPGGIPTLPHGWSLKNGQFVQG